jgi:hypothetical protein
MNQLILLCFVIIVIEIVLLYRDQTQENYAYKKFDTVDSNSMSCQRNREYNTVWTGYQTGTSPQPPVYWPDKNSEMQTKSWQNYKTFDTPLEETRFKPCDDAYRCRQYGVATGVQGKIF